MFDKGVIEYLIKRVENKREDDKRGDISKIASLVVYEYLISRSKRLIHKYTKLYRSVCDGVGYKKNIEKTRRDE